MKAVVSALVLSLTLTMAVDVVDARKPLPRIKFAELKGEWIGQGDSGEVFRLTLASKSSGSIGYVRPMWPNEDARVWSARVTNFDGVKIQIEVLDPEYGNWKLYGLARGNWMDLVIKGLARKKGTIRMVRPDNWVGALDRLRDGMEP